MNKKYEVRRNLRPENLRGISENQIAQHWTLYEGYVKNANALNDRMRILAEGKNFGMEFAELKRRLGFESNGVILHEHYFGILKAGQRPPGAGEGLTLQFDASFGGFDNWKAEFSAMGAMRGVGWVILYFDPARSSLENLWIGLHDEGHPAGCVPLLVMDAWEHSYMVDHGADGRGAYVEAFLKNVDWPKVARSFASMGKEPRLEMSR